MTSRSYCLEMVAISEARGLYGIMAIVRGLPREHNSLIASKLYPISSTMSATLFAPGRDAGFRAILTPSFSQEKSTVSLRSFMS